MNSPCMDHQRFLCVILQIMLVLFSDRPFGWHFSQQVLLFFGLVVGPGAQHLQRYNLQGAHCEYSDGGHRSLESEGDFVW
jgi:hypothetical protein